MCTASVNKGNLSIECFCTLQDCSKYDFIKQPPLIYCMTNTHFHAPDFLPGLQPTLMFPWVRDLQPPTGHAGSQGMCPCYSLSSLLWSCNRKPWAETSPGLHVRNLKTFSREEATRVKGQIWRTGLTLHIRSPEVTASPLFVWQVTFHLCYRSFIASLS